MLFSDKLNFSPPFRYNAVRKGGVLPVQKEFPYRIRLVAEAEHKIPVTMVAVVIHDMPQNWLLTDRNHRFWNPFRILANSCAEAAAEQYDLHRALHRRQTTSAGGLEIGNRHPRHARKSSA